MCTLGRRRGCKPSATVRLVCSGWKCRHDALAGPQVLCALTDEGMQAVSTSLDLWGCSKVTDEGERVLSLTGRTSKRYHTPMPV